MWDEFIILDAFTCSDELAMERLTAQDRAAGIKKRSLTDGQKKRIADLRQRAKASLAELEILRDKSIAEALGDPEKLAEINEHYTIDRKRVESRLEGRGWIASQLAAASGDA